MSKRFSITKAEVEKLQQAQKNAVEENTKLKQEVVKYEKTISELKDRFTNATKSLQDEIAALREDLLFCMRLMRGGRR